MRLRQGSAGFTLVEVLVALVVTALLLAIVMNAAVEAKARLKTAAERSAAVVLADALLAERALAPFEPASRSGEQDRLRWTLAERAIETDPRGLFVLSHIEVEIRGERGARLVAAETRKLKAAPR